MELLVKDLINTSSFTLDYLFKILRELNINNRILLNNDDLIKLRRYLKTNCTTDRRYKMYIYINSHLTNQGLCNEY